MIKSRAQPGISNTIETFWERANKRDRNECWLWTGTLNEHGYGLFSFGGKYHQANRFSYRLHKGGCIPPNVCICHACDNPACVNPHHLWMGSHEDNRRETW